MPRFWQARSDDLLLKLGLQFENKQVEAEYLSERRQRERKTILIVMVLSIALFGLFGFWDSANSVEGSQQSRFRFLYAIPTLVTFVMLWLSNLFRARDGTVIWMFATLTSALAVGQILHYKDGPLALDSGSAALNFTLICVAGIGLFPLDVVWSIIVGLTPIIVYAIAVAAFTRMPLSMEAAYLFNIFNIFGVMIIMSYWRELFARGEFHRNVLQEKERQKLSTFLSSYIPLSSIDSNKSSPSAESFGEVTLLFSDIVGFTALTERLAPKHVIEILDQIFSEFDAAAERLGVEQIKTIGDAYMAISGKSADQTNHAKAMIDFAFEAIDVAENISKKIGYPLKIRVGIHTGSTIGGVIGRHRRVYDYWGKTVNLASRLETTSEPNKIHISEATYWRVREFFNFEDRGHINMKGIGSERSFFALKK